MYELIGVVKDGNAIVGYVIQEKGSNAEIVTASVFDDYVTNRKVNTIIKEKDSYKLDLGLKVTVALKSVGLDIKGLSFNDYCNNALATFKKSHVELLKHGFLVGSVLIAQRIENIGMISCKFLGNPEVLVSASNWAKAKIGKSGMLEFSVANNVGDLSADTYTLKTLLEHDRFLLNPNSIKRELSINPSAFIYKLSGTNIHDLEESSKNSLYNDILKKEHKKEEKFGIKL